MLAITQGDFRKHMTQLLDGVVKESQTVLVVRNNRENVVVISEEEYNALKNNVGGLSGQQKRKQKETQKEINQASAGR